MQAKDVYVSGRMELENIHLLLKKGLAEKV